MHSPEERAKCAQTLSHHDSLADVLEQQYRCVSGFLKSLSSFYLHSFPLLKKKSL